MRALRLIFMFSLITSCSYIQAQYILTLHCSQMDAYIGKTFNVRVTERESGWEVGRKTIAPIDTEDFSLDLYVLLAPHSYNIDFYVDVNDNGAYDAPLTDHAWRRVLISPDKDTIVNFHPGKTFTDITFPDVFPYSTYNATWGGKWKNLTFGTTDSIEAGFNVRCDSILGFFRTKNVFGNPAPVEYTSANPRPSDNTIIPDTLHYAVIPPWSGDIYFTNGDLYGDLALATLGFHFRGTVGEKQMLGLYTITNSGVQFANGYFYVRELEIISSTATLQIETVNKSDISCNGSNDGFISLSSSGGTPGYSYLWADSMTTPLISTLSPGTYSVTVTDSGCSTAQASFDITEPEPLEVALNSLTEVSCNGLNDGFISIAGEGGTAGYTYLWSNSLTTAEISSLAPGSYSVTITDSNGCSASNSFEVLQPQPIVFINIVATPETCFGACDGTITIAVTGGMPPYSYDFPNELCAGAYTVFVQDANGCQAQADFIIHSAPEINLINEEIINETNGQSNGEITILATGGSAPFLYSINGIAYQPSNTFTGLAAGNYTGSIKDANGCILYFEFVVDNITAVKELHASFTLYPNPASSEIYLQSDLSVSVEMMDIHGRIISEMQKSSVHHIQTDHLARGAYILRIFNEESCAYRKILLE